MTLTFHLLTSKVIVVMYWSSSTSLWSFMILGPSILELSSRKYFMFPCPGDLDLWPTDLKNNRLPLLIITKLPMKFHDPRTKRSWVIIRTTFGGPTDRQTDRPTDRPTDRHLQNNIPPTSSMGGHNKICLWNTNMSLIVMTNVNFFFKVDHRSRSEIKFVWEGSPCHKEPTCQIWRLYLKQLKSMTNVNFFFKVGHRWSQGHRSIFFFFFVWMGSPCHKEPTCQIWRLYLKLLENYDQY